MGSLQKLQLIKELFGVAFGMTDSFEGEIGANLAYLMGAIANDDSCFVAMKDNRDDMEFYEFIENLFDKGHAIYGFIRVE